jgi:hypothetical protein
MKEKFRFLSWLAVALMLMLGTLNAQSSWAENEAVATATDQGGVTINLDKTTLNNGGQIEVTGKAPAGKAVFIEVVNVDKKVRANRFDSDEIKGPDKDGKLGASDKYYVEKLGKKEGERPHVFYLTEKMPAFYQILVPKDKKELFDAEKNKKRNGWSMSVLIKGFGDGASAAFNDTFGSAEKIKIDHYQSTLLANIVGSRGDLLAALDDKNTTMRAMQLVKARFRSIGKVFAVSVDVQPDGVYKAAFKLPAGSAPGTYKIAAIVDKDSKAETTFSNAVAFPTVYMEAAGTSLNLLWPFVLTLVIAIFGVMMGAGGGFIMNPLFAQLFPTLPHTIIAGTVMPTVLFSQGSGIINYSKIKFISWKLGVGIGLAMMCGGFIGPKLTELITLEQFKFAFGWILVVLALLMFWQTTPGYLEKNKKEQAILKEFKKRAEEAAKAKQA